MTLKLRNGVSTADTDYGTTLLDEDSGQYWNLNPTGALVLRTLLDGGTPAQAVQELTEPVRGGRGDRQPGRRGPGRRPALGRPGEGGGGRHEHAGSRLPPAPVGAPPAPGGGPPGGRRRPAARHPVPPAYPDRAGLAAPGARPATFEQAKAARDTVVAVSLICAAREGCVPRSLATILLCRLRGRWPTWCVGARRLPPFAAHAWVEADGIMVGEDYPPDYFRTLFTVP